MVTTERITAWRPSVPGITEAFHARFTDHVYPMHTHEAWTLLIVDAGAVRYDLDHHEHGALRATVTLLPPHVPHNGEAASSGGFRKRVLYLDAAQLGPRLIGPAVDAPDIRDAAMRDQIDRLHRSLWLPGDELEAESRFSLIRDRLRRHLEHRPVPVEAADPGLAHRLRDLLDARVVAGLTLAEASRILHAHPAHLVRSFSRAFGLAPHQFLTGRRVDLARRLLLDGMPPAQAAVASGHHDQSHLTRHFKRVVGTTPGRFATSRKTNALTPARLPLVAGTLPAVSRATGVPPPPPRRPRPPVPRPSPRRGGSPGRGAPR
ncbi:helix-turn-helix domain-containing protein [Stackebrandtia nassauensis]|uniref:Transcriptional regulator, AraC family n=1 Tax=Stackebrandtia nassauensis (strain DSM 44728 / CIP 108903 / NRRL B-16338 / NBRC 102104 / LLR-40K-21) TaxID=446470 RepID=D3Q1Z1_STANL|nr:AraC family transcriptional regulator [Stackebrandtia nassauensis]ADD41858.1 transcriptional regulator, AraC family [Stackebrandtia nassauensis DSM 44728]